MSYSYRSSSYHLPLLETALFYQDYQKSFDPIHLPLETKALFSYQDYRVSVELEPMLSALDASKIAKLNKMIDVNNFACNLTNVNARLLSQAGDGGDGNGGDGIGGSPVSGWCSGSSVNGGAGGGGSISDDDLPEDSIYSKLLSCVPLLGIIPTVINESSLKKKIMQTNEKNTDRLVKLIDTKNHYKWASIVRELLSVALIVSTVAFGILSGGIAMGVAIGSTIVGGSLIAFYAHGIHKNKQYINILKTNTFPPNMQVR